MSEAKARERIKRNSTCVMSKWYNMASTHKAHGVVRVTASGTRICA